MIGIKEIWSRISNMVNLYGEIGAVYITTNNTNPSVYFGGSWTKIEGRFLVGAGGSFAVNSTGGAQPASITASHLPQHTHSAICSGDDQSTRSGSTHNFLFKNNSGGTYLVTTYTGSAGTTTHENRPPYYVFHIWVRNDGSATLTYNANEGLLNNVPSSQALQDSQAAYISSYTPSRENYLFLGWGDSNNAREAIYQPGDLFKTAGAAAVSTMIYAVWAKQRVNIHLTPITVDEEGTRTASSEGGTVEGPIIVDYDTPTTIIARPNPGYVFKGWATSTNPSVYVSTQRETIITPTGDVQLYAIFEYASITFYINNAPLGAPGSITWDEWVNTDFNVTEDIIVENGYVLSDVSDEGGYSKYLYSNINPNMLVPSNTLYPNEAFTPGGKVSSCSEIIQNGRYYTGAFLELAPESLNTYTVTTQTVNATIATTSGGGTFDAGAAATVKVNLGTVASFETITSTELLAGGEEAEFLGWYPNNTGSGTPLSLQPKYTFNVNGNTNLYAHFKGELRAVVSTPEGATYGFVQCADNTTDTYYFKNESSFNNNWYKSTNEAIANSMSLALVTFTLANNATIAIDVLDYQNESSCDYGTIGLLDSNTLSTSTYSTSYSQTSGAISWTGSSNHIQGGETVIFENVSSGTHTLYIRYRKDSSVDNANDKFYFRINLYSIAEAPTIYTITYNMNGHGNVPTKINKIFAGDTLKVLTPSATGYTFNGWYTDSELTQSFTSGSVVNSNITLYAKWTAKTYNLTYKDVGNTEFSGVHEANYPTTHVYGELITLDTPTKDGYTFDGYFTSSSGSGSPITTLQNSTTTTLYAKWTAIE